MNQAFVGGGVISLINQSFLWWHPPHRGGQGGQGLDSRLVRAGMSRADEMLVSGVGDCWWRRGSQTRRSFVWVRLWIMRMLRMRRMMKAWVWWWWGRWWSRSWWCCFLWRWCCWVLWRWHCESGDDEDDADDKGDDDVSLVMMRLVLMLITDADEMLVSDVMTVDDQEEARPGGRLSGFSCGWWGWCWW